MGLMLDHIIDDVSIRKTLNLRPAEEGEQRAEKGLESRAPFPRNTSYMYHCKAVTRENVSKIRWAMD